MGEKIVMADLKHYAGISLEGMKKTDENSHSYR
jgi:hypothetical protein